jgi:hypothetical protein
MGLVRQSEAPPQVPLAFEMCSGRSERMRLIAASWPPILRQQISRF